MIWVVGRQRKAVAKRLTCSDELDKADSLKPLEVGSRYGFRAAGRWNDRIPSVQSQDQRNSLSKTLTSTGKQHDAKIVLRNLDLRDRLILEILPFQKVLFPELDARPVTISFRIPFRKFTPRVASVDDKVLEPLGTHLFLKRPKRLHAIVITENNTAICKTSTPFEFRARKECVELHTARSEDVTGPPDCHPF